jgi:uncharacterized Fe-S cluster protein YjdI
MASGVHQYTGEEIVVRWDESRCIKIEQCIKALPAVFDRSQQPWVQVNAASANEVAAVVERCSTGALQCRRLDGGPEEQVQATPSITARPPGPIIARGDLQIELLDGTTVSTPRAMLCGCGHSANRPFCDGAHRDVELGS